MSTQELTTLLTELLAHPKENEFLEFKVNQYDKEENYSIASRVMRDTLEAGLIKLENPENKSKKYTTYVPFWA